MISSFRCPAGRDNTMSRHIRDTKKAFPHMLAWLHLLLSRFWSSALQGRVWIVSPIIIDTHQQNRWALTSDMQLTRTAHLRLSSHMSSPESYLSSKLEVVRKTLKSIPAYLSVLITRSSEVRGQIGLTGNPLNTDQLMIARSNEGNGY